MLVVRVERSAALFLLRVVLFRRGAPFDYGGAACAYGLHSLLSALNASAHLPNVNMINGAPLPAPAALLRGRTEAGSAF